MGKVEEETGKAIGNPDLRDRGTAEKATISPGTRAKPGATTSSISTPAVSDMITEARYQARKNGRSAIAQQTFAAHFSIIRFRPIKRWNRHSSRR